MGDSLGTVSGYRTAPPRPRAAHPRASRRRSLFTLRPGFTLAELMVSVGVLLILLTMVGWIFATATRSSGIATAHNEMMGTARAAENQFGRDFEGLLKDSFIGVWYQLTEDPRYAGMSGPTRYVRTDRIVFYTVGDHSSVKQLRGPGPTSMWTTALLAPPATPSSLATYSPIRGSMARVVLGHSFAADPTGPTPNPDPPSWILARRFRVVAPDLNIPAVASAMASAGTPEEADVFEFEGLTPTEWEAQWRSMLPMPTAALVSIFGSNGWMSESQSNLWAWMRRPRVDPAGGTGTHMLFLPGCAEFKVQRWIDRWPANGQPLGPNSAYGMPRWWPEEDIDGNGAANAPASTSDFQTAMAGAAGTTLNIREYFNGPMPPPAGGGTPYYSPGGSVRWYWFGKQDIPKAIKVTIRIFDPNKRITDGEVFTMTYGVP